MNWFKRIFTRRIEITIQYGAVSWLDPKGKNKYEIVLSPNQGLDLKTVLAHELGHFMDNFDPGMDRKTSAGYSVMHKNQLISLEVLKWEASAWRNALKIYPKLDKKSLKFAFGNYVKNYKNPYWWALIQLLHTKYPRRKDERVE